MSNLKRVRYSNSAGYPPSLFFRVAEKNATQRRKISRFWLALAFLVPLLLLWVGQAVRSTQTSYQIEKVEEEIQKERRRQMELKIARDRLISLDSIEALAQKKLGLIVPAEDNIVLISSASEN